VAWGANEKGQCALDTDRHRFCRQPQEVSLISDATRVACGYNFSVVVTAMGEAWSWGENSYGQLGIEERTSFVCFASSFSRASDFCDVPTKVMVKDVDFSRLHGRDTVPPQNAVTSLIKGGGDMVRISDVAAGDHHTLFLTSTGAVFSCGKMDYGRLGLGHTPAMKTTHETATQAAKTSLNASDGERHLPMKHALFPPILPSIDNTLPTPFTCATADDSVMSRLMDEAISFDWCKLFSPNRPNAVPVVDSYGRPSKGVSNHFKSEHSCMSGVRLPTRIRFFDRHGISIRRLAAGGASSAGISSGGALFTWGYNGNGQLGLGTHSKAYGEWGQPALVTFLKGQPKMSFTDSSAHDGRCRCHCRDHAMYNHVKHPLYQVESVAIGEDHMLAVTNNGTVWVWGSALSGRLGIQVRSTKDETEDAYAVPQVLLTSPDIVVKGATNAPCSAVQNEMSVVAGGAHSVLVVTPCGSSIQRRQWLTSTGASPSTGASFCVFEDVGCSVTTLPSNRRAHALVCPHRCLQCPFSAQGCGFKGHERNMSAHVRTCDFKPESNSHSEASSFWETTPLQLPMFDTSRQGRKSCRILLLEMAPFLSFPSVQDDSECMSSVEERENKDKEGVGSSPSFSLPRNVDPTLTLDKAKQGSEDELGRNKSRGDPLTLPRPRSVTPISSDCGDFLYNLDGKDRIPHKNVWTGQKEREYIYSLDDARLCLMSAVSSTSENGSSNRITPTSTFFIDKRKKSPNPNPKRKTSLSLSQQR
jgi:alpha-tubulin suppressor-like RCC1 family protein